MSSHMYRSQCSIDFHFPVGLFREHFLGTIISAKKMVAMDWYYQAQILVYDYPKREQCFLECSYLGDLS